MLSTIRPQASDLSRADRAAAGNVAVRLAELAARQPGRLALVEYRHGRPDRLTYGDLAARVRKVAARLRRAGIARGDRVLLFVPMSIDLYVTLLGCLHAGTAAVFLDAWAGRERLDTAVAAACPKAFIGTWKAQLLRLVSPSLRRIPISLDADSARPRWLGEEADPEAVDPDAPALVTCTTGSTGAPKAAARSHAFLWAQHEALAAAMALRDTDVDMPALPIVVLNNLALGITSVLPDFNPRRPGRFDPAAIIRQIRAEGVTTASGSPAFFERLARWCRDRGLQLPLRAIFTGGAPVLPPLARLLRETVNGTAHVIYGSTEAEPIAGISVDEMLEAMDHGGREGLCAGQPVAGIAARVVRPHAGPIDLTAGGWPAWEATRGEGGEIVVAGRHVLAGYLNDPAAERATKIRDGERVWHRTGDAGRFDGEGRLWLLGRVRERLRRGGRTWWSLPVEMRALAVKGITHAAYLALPDSSGDAGAALCVETPLAGRRGALPSNLREQLVAAAAARVDEVYAFSRLPRDPRHASKTDTEALRQMLRRLG